MRIRLAVALALLTLSPATAQAHGRHHWRHASHEGGRRGGTVEAATPGPGLAARLRGSRHGFRFAYGGHHRRFHGLRTPEGVEVAAATPAAAPRGKAGIFEAVTRSAMSHGVPVRLAHAIVRMESGYDCSASNGGAQGIMQVKAATAGSVGVHGGLRSCSTGLEAGMRYLKLAYMAAHGDEGHAATLYNRGLGATATSSGYGRQAVRLSRL